MKNKLIILNLFIILSAQVFSQKNEEIQALDSTSVAQIQQILNTEITINFDFNECKIKSEFINILDEFIANLSKENNYSAIIYGYTDSVGNDEDNIKLSFCRANTVKNYFIEKGISENRIQVISKGEKAAIADNNTEEGAYKNRRVVINFVKK